MVTSVPSLNSNAAWPWAFGIIFWMVESALLRFCSYFIWSWLPDCLSLMAIESLKMPWSSLLFSFCLFCRATSLLSYQSQWIGRLIDFFYLSDWSRVASKCYCDYGFYLTLYPVAKYSRQSPPFFQVWGTSPDAYSSPCNSDHYKED